MKKDILNKSSVYQQHGDYWCQVFDCEVLLQSREEIFRRFCEAKKVLHVGCTDYPFDGLGGLHASLENYCEVDGVDTDRRGVDTFRQHFKGDFFYSLEDVNKSYDIVIVPEVLEHVDNAGSFLSQINKLASHKLIVTVPDCLSCFQYNHFEFLENTYFEAVHPDHVAWYSPHTLKNIIQRNTDYKCTEFYRVNGRSIMTVAEKS